MVKYELIDGGAPIHIDIKKYRELRALAYQRGIQNSPGKTRFLFEQQAFDKGRADEAYLQTEILNRKAP